MSAHRLSSLAWVVLAGALACSSCTAVLRRDHDQCHTSDDCQSLALGAVCTQSGICERLVAPPPVLGEPQACGRDADCAADPWSVCRSGACLPLAGNGCIGWDAQHASSTRDRLPLAVLVPAAELSRDAPGAHLRAAWFAIGELRDGFEASGGTFPEIIAVACDEDNPAAYAPLTDAGVRLLLGPMSSEAVENARSAVAGRAVLFSPYADAPTLESPSIAPSSSIVSCKPNRSGAKASLLSAAAFIQQQLYNRMLIAGDSHAVLALSETEKALGIADLFGAAELDAASLKAVPYVDDPPGQGLVSELGREGLTPSLLVAASTEESWSEIIDAVDASARPPAYPFYLLADKQAAIAALVAETNASDHPVDPRTFGLDFALSAKNLSVHQAFVTAFEPDVVEPGLDYVRDCAYLAAYAAEAGLLRYSLTTEELGPAAILGGLRAFDGGGGELSVGADAAIVKVLQALQGSSDFDGSVKLIGGSGDFDLQGVPSIDAIAHAPATQYVRPSPRDRALYCTDATLGFYDGRVLFPSSGAAPSADAAHTFSCLGDARP